MLWSGHRSLSLQSLTISTKRWRLRSSVETQTWPNNTRTNLKTKSSRKSSGWKSQNTCSITRARRRIRLKTATRCSVELNRKRGLLSTASVKRWTFSKNQSLRLTTCCHCSHLMRKCKTWRSICANVSTTIRIRSNLWNRNWKTILNQLSSSESSSGNRSTSISRLIHLRCATFVSNLSSTESSTCSHAHMRSTGCVFNRSSTDTNQKTSRSTQSSPK